MAALLKVLQSCRPKRLAKRPRGPNMFKLLGNRRGATAIEYGLIAALIAVVGVASFTAFGSQIKSTLNNATSHMKKG